MNQERFDDLMRALATGRISRRQLLKAAAVAAVAAGTLLNQRQAEAAQQAADLKRFYAGIKSDTQVEHEFGGMKAGILTPQEYQAEQHAERPVDEATQRDLDWHRIWQEEFRFCGIKATEGPYPNRKRYTDPYYAINVRRSKEAGFVRFPYHFLVNAPIREQVVHFLHVTGAGGWGRGQCPLIDFEAYPDFPSLSPKRDHLYGFIRQLRERIGREPLIFVYAGKDYTDSIGGIDLSTFDNVCLWDAAYYLGSKHGYASALWHEIVNAGYHPFAKARWGQRSKKVSQFTCTAKVAGKQMDADARHGDLHDLRHATGWEAA